MGEHVLQSLDPSAIHMQLFYKNGSPCREHVLHSGAIDVCLYPLRAAPRSAPARQINSTEKKMFAIVLMVGDGGGDGHGDGDGDEDEDEDGDEHADADWEKDEDVNKAMRCCLLLCGCWGWGGGGMRI